MMRPLRTCCLSFLSRRFSLSVLPDFFDATFRGDLSAMPTPFRRSILLSGHARRSAFHRIAGVAMRGLLGETSRLGRLNPLTSVLRVEEHGDPTPSR
jgi:hypothetical protein